MTARRSFCEMAPWLRRADTACSTLHASLAKSRSRTSMAGTGTSANASLSSLTMASPTADTTVNRHRPQIVASLSLG